MSESAVTIEVAEKIIGKNQRRRDPNGIGRLHFSNRKQYIIDKLVMLRDDFLVTPTMNDIHELCDHCFTIRQIDYCCRRMILRSYSNN